MKTRRKYTKEFEQGQIIKAKEGDQAAINWVLTSHKWLIDYTAFKYSSTYDREMEIKQACRIGLYLALLKYDTNQTSWFSTYAYWYIKDEVSKLLVYYDNTVIPPKGFKKTDLYFKHAINNVINVDFGQTEEIEHQDPTVLGQITDQSKGNVIYINEYELFTSILDPQTKKIVDLIFVKEENKVEVARQFRLSSKRLNELLQDAYSKIKQHFLLDICHNVYYN